MKTRGRSIPRPFLKWVGGKGQLLGELLPWVARAAPFERYHEPFIGGGALYFELHRTGVLEGVEAFLSDMNPRLMETYQQVQLQVEAVIELLREHQERHNREHYYAVRASVPGDSVERAARIIYLNKTCFNGLYRENSQGLFNVPMGKYKNPAICDEENLRAVSRALQQAHLGQQDFRALAKRARPGDFVYFDPPYDPVSATSSFTSYDQNNFGREDQEALADLCTCLDEKGVKLLLSNAYTPFIRNAYKVRRFSVKEVLATRMVNSKAERRGKVSEALVHNIVRRPGQAKNSS